MNNTNENLHYFLDKNLESFTEEDILKFQEANQQYNDLYIETSNKVTNKLFVLSKVLLEQKDKVEDPTPEILDKEITQPIEATLPDTFSGLKILVEEVIEDENIEFLNILTQELNDIDHLLQEEAFSIEALYDRLSEMLKKLQGYNISQQKYIYRMIADAINKNMTKYKLISPEDGNFVELKFHKIVSGNGQRISRGLTYILLDTATEEVLKFGNVKTS